MDKSTVVKKINERGFSAKEEDGMIFVDFTKESDEKARKGIEDLKITLKEIGYGSSYGIKYNDSLLGKNNK